MLLADSVGMLEAALDFSEFTRGYEQLMLKP